MIAPVPILRYHSVSDDPPSGFAPYAVSRRQFAAHLDQLAALRVPHPHRRGAAPGPGERDGAAGADGGDHL